MMKTFLLALALDLTVGDPPNSAHPVAWMGALIAELRKRLAHESRLRALLGGGVIALGGAYVMWLIGHLISAFISKLPSPLDWMAEAAVLQLMFSLSGLTNAAREVQRPLQRGDLDEARKMLSWHLVSRDTTALNESDIAASTIESVAENSSDGVIAPLFFYAVGGLPAAIAYRYANTCDAMLGYRDAEREWLGKIPARFDDLLNLVPARLTALCITGAAAVKLSSDRALRTWQRDARTTDSPNAGHPMSAMAGGLSVTLRKKGQYQLGYPMREPQARDIGRSVLLMRIATALSLPILVWIGTRFRQNNNTGRILDTDTEYG